jgi:hypothetical protein
MSYHLKSDVVVNGDLSDNVWARPAGGTGSRKSEFDSLMDRRQMPIAS